jgi:hypothetical protein
MGAAKPRAPRLFIGAVALSVLGMAGLLMGALSVRRGGKVASGADGVTAEEDHVAQPPRAPAAPMSRLPPRAAVDEGAIHRAEEQRKANVLLDGVRLRMLNIVPNPEAIGIESVGNAMEPYVQGSLATLRAVNPELIGGLRDALVERTCAHPQTDVELMLAARMVLTDSDLGSPRIFDCALRGRKKEDVVLWTMLDAWRAAGRPNAQVISDITAFATDDRTVGRLSENSPQELERLAAAERARAAAEANDQQQPKNANRKEIAQ